MLRTIRFLGLVATFAASAACGTSPSPTPDAGRDEAAADAHSGEADAGERADAATPTDSGTDPFDAGEHPADAGTGAADAGDADAGGIADGGDQADAGEEPDAGPAQVCEPGVFRCSGGQRLRCANDGMTEVPDDSPVTETFTATAKVDVVFVVAESPWALYDRIGAAITERLLAGGVDFRVGVMSVGAVGSPRGELVSAPGRPAVPPRYPGDPGTPAVPPRPTIVTPGPDAPADVAANIHRAGDEYLGAHEILGRMWESLSGGTVHDMLRPGARLSIVVLTDEDDDDSPGPVASYVSFIESLMTPSMSAFHAVGHTENEGEELSRIEHVATHTGGVMYDYFPLGQYWHDVANAPLAADPIAAWSALAAQVFTLRERATTVVVRVGGVEVPATLSADGLSVVLQAAPLAGATLEVEHDAVCP